MYKICLTGASPKSFIGRHLMTYLGSLGYEVDTISHQEFMNEDWRRLDNFQLHEEFSKRPLVINHDGLSKEIKVKYVLEKPDIVVHCAWPKQDLHSTEHLEFAEMSCNFFNECKKRGIRVINLGSSSEYGVKDVPMKEDMICEPINTYGIAKLAVTLYAKKLGFNTLRLFTVTGEGGHSFFDNDSDWTKWEYPTSVRTVIPVKIVCKAVERLIYAEHIYGEIINVGTSCEYRYGGNNCEVPINDKDSKWLKAPQKQYEPKHWLCDTTKMSNLLNL